MATIQRASFIKIKSCKTSVTVTTFFNLLSINMLRLSNGDRWFENKAIIAFIKRLLSKKQMLFGYVFIILSMIISQSAS